MLGGTEGKLEMRMIIRGEAITYHFGVDPHRWNNNSEVGKRNCISEINSIHLPNYFEMDSPSKILEQ